jgi:hypothetical protein
VPAIAADRTAVLSAVVYESTRKVALASSDQPTLSETKVKRRAHSTKSGHFRFGRKE